MESDDDNEMRRLCSMLEAIHGMLPDPSPLREALVKGALAIQFVFASGNRRRIDEPFARLEDLTRQQRDEFLR